MSRSKNERTSSKRSKMDRYTEDLKYSLRRRLSESVDKGALRTDDILARNHRQIVSDFTDPRQWYYSATHDYIIAIMRESHKQNGGSVWGSRGSRKEERSPTSRNHSSPAMLAKEGRRGRNGGSFIEIPTVTSEDLQEIRGAGETGHSDTSDIKHNLSEETIKKKELDRGFESSEQTLTSKIDAKNGDRFVKGRISPEGKSNIASKQDATVPLHVNTYHDISVPSTDCIKLDISASVKSEDTSEDYTVSAMEAYRVSKQSQQHNIISQKQNIILASAGNINNYFPGKMESFVPVGRRRKVTSKTTAAGVSLPLIGKTAQTEQPVSQRTNLYKVRRGRVGSRKRRLCPLTNQERGSAKADDLPYVEDWIRKLQIDGKDLASDKHLKPIERVDETFPHISKQRPHMVKDSPQLMDLPSDFDPVPGFQSFQPHPSLYLYSLKQKSDLNVKFQYLDIPKPVKQLADQSGSQQKQSFKNDLTQVRSKVNYIEDRLGKLYQGETNLVKIVSRQEIKPFKKHDGRFLDISTGLTGRASDQNIPLQERPVERHGHDEGFLPKPKDSVENEAVSLSKVADGGQSKMHTIELGISSDEPPSDDPTSNTSKLSTQGDDVHATSTSSWKQQCPVSPGRPRDGRAVEGKTLRVFHERSDGRDVRMEDHTAKVLKKGEDDVIASVQDCNASGSVVDLNADAYVESEAEDQTGSMLLVAVLEVLGDIMNRIDSPESIVDHPPSIPTSGNTPTEDVPIEEVTKERLTNEFEINMKDDSSQQTMKIERQCSFCDEPH